MRSWFKKMHQVFSHTITLLMRGKETWIMLVFGTALLLTMLFSMDDVKEEKSKIAIGIADEDASAFSEQVLLRLKELDGYEISEGEQASLLGQLKSGELSAVCVIREGYQENVIGGEAEDLVLVYETEQKNLLFTDVLAGTMIQEICSAKGYLLFKEYMEEKNGVFLETLEEYQTYTETYFDNTKFNFSFDVEYLSSSGEESKKPGNEIIYLQAIFAIAAMMMGFLTIYTTMPYHRLCHGRISKKMATLPVQRSAVLVGCMLGSVLVAGGFAAVFLGVFAIRNAMTFSTFLAFLVCTLLYICVIVCVMFLCASGVKSTQGYQIGMVALVLVFAVFGLISIVDGLLLPEGISAWIPNGWYVREMTEIYQK